MCEDPGVLWCSAVVFPAPAPAAPVRRRLDGGMMDEEAEGEGGWVGWVGWVGGCFGPSWSDIASEATEERGELGESAIGEVNGENAP